jgi:hypothetical protein
MQLFRSNLPLACEDQQRQIRHIHPSRMSGPIVWLLLPDQTFSAHCGDLAVIVNMLSIREGNALVKRCEDLLPIPELFVKGY